MLNLRFIYVRFSEMGLITSFFFTFYRKQNERKYKKALEKDNFAKLIEIYWERYAQNFRNKLSLPKNYACLRCVSKRHNSKILQNVVP